MRFIHSRALALITLLGCGGSSHDGADAGNPGKNANDGSSGKRAAVSGSGANAGKGGPSGGSSGSASGMPSAGAGPGAGNAAQGGKGAAYAGNTGAQGGNGNGSGGSSAHLDLPRVYPPVRANTPNNLIADPAFQAPGQPSLDVITPSDIEALPQGLGGAINLALAVQERLYTAGPTEILRIVQELDSRTSALDTNPSTHPCLTGTPTPWTLNLPGAQTFALKLQCISQWSTGFMAFGFDSAQADEDAGVDVHGAHDFYLVEGQEGGMGGAYRIHGGSGDVEAWITVADSRTPNNSQVIMHLLTNTAAGTTELALGGASVGLCSAHLKTGPNFLFIRAKTNGAQPPGTPMSEVGQYCDASRSGCFATSALDTDLGGDAADCASIAGHSFGIATELDASTDPEANVAPATIYQYFNAAPTGIAAF